MSSRPIGQHHRSSPMFRSAMLCAGYSMRGTVNLLPSLIACCADSCGKALLANEWQLAAGERGPTVGSAMVQRRNDKEDYRPAVRLSASRVLRRVAMTAITKFLAGGVAAAAMA